LCKKSRHRKIQNRRRSNPLTSIIRGSICWNADHSGSIRWKKDAFIALDVKITDAQEGLHRQRDRIVRGRSKGARRTGPMRSLWRPVPFRQ
jgi:hypothetical protein